MKQLALLFNFLVKASTKERLYAVVLPSFGRESERRIINYSGHLKNDFQGNCFDSLRFDADQWP